MKIVLASILAVLAVVAASHSLAEPDLNAPIEIVEDAITLSYGELDRASFVGRMGTTTFKDGKPAERIVGAVPKKVIVDTLHRVVA